MISAIADESASQSQDEESAVTFTVYIDFTPDENTRFGMSAVVTTLDGAEAEEEAEEQAEEEAEDAGEADDRRDGPEGREPGQRPGETEGMSGDAQD